MEARLSRVVQTQISIQQFRLLKQRDTKDIDCCTYRKDSKTISLVCSNGGMILDGEEIEFCERGSKDGIDDDWAWDELTYSCSN
jgi:hypothetical protein